MVWTRHQSRVLFVQLTQLQGQRDDLNIEYGKLELEQATWAEPRRIDNEARSKLGMVHAEPAEHAVGAAMNPRPRIPAKPAARRQGVGPSARRRMLLVVGLLGAASVGLVARAFDLQVVRKQFYQDQGDARFLREVPIAVSRGTIFDRNGEPLAVSTPMVSITAVPSRSARKRRPHSRIGAGAGHQSR